MTLFIAHVEDDPDIREIAKMALEFAGDFAIVQYEHGADCLEKLNGDVPDVFLLDMMMPGMDGLALMGELRKRPAYKDVPVIFMTARVQSSEIQPLRDAGAAGVIPKPFDPIDLGQQIRKILGET